MKVKYISTLGPLRSQSESTKRPLVPLKVKVKNDKRIKYYYFEFWSTSRGFNGYKRRSTHFILHTLAHQSLAPRRLSLALEEKEEFLFWFMP